MNLGQHSGFFGVFYPYGFNGMESDDEAKGEGNSYTTEFRQYDPRLGRWLSLDPVVKPHLSPYNSMSNNPISRIDPRGDDDYFNADGSWNEKMSKENNKNGHRIYVLSADGKSKTLLSDMPIKTETEKAVVMKVIDGYAEKVGIKKGTVDLLNYEKKNKKDRTAGAFTSGDDIFINTNWDKTGKMSDLLSNYHNLQNTLEHEKKHKDGEYSGFGLEHAKLASDVMSNDNFKRSSKEYKEATVRGMFGMLVEEIETNFTREDGEQKINAFIEGFNQKHADVLGYKIQYQGAGDHGGGLNGTGYTKYMFKYGKDTYTQDVDKPKMK